MSVKITEPCRFPFVCDPGHCDCRPSDITITLRNANLNARARADMNTYARDAMMLITIGMAAFFACFAGAAFVNQANSNIKQWVAENEPV